jgi:hypothetical protein
VRRPLGKPPRHAAATIVRVFWIAAALLVPAGGWVLAAGNVLGGVACLAGSAGVVLTCAVRSTRSAP